MLAKYKGMTEKQKWEEYARLKNAWAAANGYADSEAYDAMINRITEELGI